MSIHTPVLPNEVLEILSIQPNDTVLDGTFGGGGHSVLIADRLDPQQGSMICLDLDSDAIERGSVTMSPFVDAGLNVQFIQRSFADFAETEIAEELRPNKILLDLGWSMDQFSDPLRGFSFQHDGPLDMRLDNSGTAQTAAEMLQSIDEYELVDILQTFGEETRAKSIAKSIMRAVEHKEMNTTFDLVRAVERVAPRSGPTHPATKTFQAIRIAVNHEIGTLTIGIPALIEILPSGGRLCIITFHSIEDRIVKQIFDAGRKEGVIHWVNKHVITPSDSELHTNPRSRSAKIRCIEKI